MEIEFFTLFVLLVTGILAGITGPFTASSSLIVIPVLLFVGFEIKEALAMNMFSSFISWIVISRHMLVANHVKWKFVPALLILAIIGSIAGTVLAIRTPPDFLTEIIGSLIILSALLFILTRKVGIEEKQRKFKYHVLGLFLHALTNIYAGFFAGGSGIIYRLINISCFGFTILQSAATGGLSWVVVAGVSAFIYAYYGYISFENTLYAGLLAVVMGIASHYSTKLMLITNPQTIKNVFVGFAVLAGLWIILGK